MTVEIKGEIKLIGELQTFDSGFTKQQLVVTEPGQYPNDIPIDFLKDKTDFLQNFNVGDNVIVNANIRGSEYSGKHYVNLTAWTIKKDGGVNSTFSPSTNTNPQEFKAANQSNSFVDDQDETLPF
jgi:hypothetical protein